MCAKKLSHPPKLEPDFRKPLKTGTTKTPKKDEDTSEPDTPKPKTRKPKIAGYLLIIVVIMVAFEIVNTINSGDDYVSLSAPRSWGMRKTQMAYFQG